MTKRVPLLSRAVPLLSWFSVALLISTSVVAQSSVHRAKPAAPGTREAKQKTQKELTQKKESEKRQELKRNALALLDEVVAEVSDLKLPENRSFVLGIAGDLLWTHDENRARNLFWESMSSLSPIINERPQPGFGFCGFEYLRSNLLAHVTRRNLQLAFEMLRSSRPPPPENAYPDYVADIQRSHERQIIMETAVGDPKQILQVGRDILARSVTFDLLEILVRLNEQKPEMASEFAAEVITKLKTANPVTETDVAGLASQVLRLGRTPPDIVATLGRLNLDDDQRRDLVEILTNAALSESADEGILVPLSEIMPEVERFAPDRAAKLNTKLTQFFNALSPEKRNLEAYPLTSNGTPEEILKKAETADDLYRTSYYEVAVAVAVMRGQADSLRDFINGQIKDESQRNRVIGMLDAEQVDDTAYRGKIDEMQSLLPHLQHSDERGRAVARIAILLERKGDHGEAVKLLNEAQALVKVDPGSATQSHGLATLVLADALVDPDRAFAIIEPMIDRDNDYIAQLVVSDKAIKRGYVKSGEIVFALAGGIQLSEAMLEYGKGVVALAKADFGRTKAAVNRFQRNELRILAKLLIAQALLRNLEKIANEDDSLSRANLPLRPHS